MILDEITLCNFGLYAGRQTIPLKPKSRSKPIILLGGLNGGGKTTFLDALQLCLFGPHARISNRGSLPYNKYLDRSIHRGADLPEAGIEITFRHTSEGQESTYKLKRFWHRINGNCKEEFRVWKDGLEDPTLAENWAAQVEEFVPPNIAHLFLFDGEQIEGYVSQEHSSELIGSAIQNLLGLDMVDRLEKDLAVFERRKRSEKKDDVALAVIREAEEGLRDLRQKADKLNQDRASVKTYDIDRVQRELTKVEDEYRKLGGDLFDQRVELEQRLADAEEATQKSVQSLQEAATGALPLAMIRGMLESANVRDRHEEECRRAREVSDVLEARDNATLEELRSRTKSKKVLEAVERFLDDDRMERRALGEEETLLDLSSGMRSDLHSLLRGDLDDATNDARHQVEQHKKQEAFLSQARSEFESIPDTDTIGQIIRKRESLKEELAETEKEYGTLTDDLDRVRRDIERQEDALVRLHETGAKVVLDRDDRSRVLHHSVKVRGTLTKFRKAVIERHVHRIEQLVLESYQSILRKESLVTRLSIDPEEFSIKLFGRDGQVLTTERLSAGERQLLGIALLWGLAKASGRSLPTAIDTPLGRLDAGHRMHLIERYLPHASHQVLLLSTDEEIVGAYQERLEEWVGKKYYLNYDDSTGKTRIVEGYFKNTEVA